MSMEIAEKILAQLGGNRFTTMTGAKNLLASEDGLTFKVGRNSKKVTHVGIVLMEATDTYLMQFWKCRKYNRTLLAEYSGIYADKLQEVFTENTGLDTHL